MSYLQQFRKYYKRHDVNLFQQTHFRWPALPLLCGVGGGFVFDLAVSAPNVIQDQKRHTIAINSWVYPGCLSSGAALAFIHFSNFQTPLVQFQLWLAVRSIQWQFSRRGISALRTSNQQATLGTTAMLGVSGRYAHPVPNGTSCPSLSDEFNFAQRPIVCHP
jgi:hypothetical protein